MLKPNNIIGDCIQASNISRAEEMDVHIRGDRNSSEVRLVNRPFELIKMLAVVVMNKKQTTHIELTILRCGVSTAPFLRTSSALHTHGK
ncbi:hypothetical protein LBM2029_00020 [Ralstonia solanacearum]|nr:hypothetical protein LBM2029_00020 [Ralstonia solanacearum]